jgi:hypothetical protein
MSLAQREVSSKSERNLQEPSGTFVLLENVAAIDDKDLSGDVRGLRRG